MARNMLVDGEWQHNVSETSDDGDFQREESVIRHRITEDGVFPPEPERYHLYMSRACPWAHGTLITAKLLGLDGITVDVVDPFRAENGWQFTPEKTDCTPDTVNGFDYLYEAYVHADPDYTGRVTVPLLWDKEENTAVNNESLDILRMFNTAFDTARDLYPEQIRDDIDARMQDLYDTINNGVYRAGFAGSQDAYDRAIDDLFTALNRYNERLAEQRFLVGNQLTIADIRLFQTLLRFDPVYHTHFKCNVKQISDYPNLHGFLKDVYQLQGVADTVNMAHIKEHYYRTHPSLNPKRIVARGPDMNLAGPHERDALPGDPLGLT